LLIRLDVAVYFSHAAQARRTRLLTFNVTSVRGLLARIAQVGVSDKHLVAVREYIEMNPVNAGLCHAAEDWLWSSAWSGR
jgi:hypothetical protein